MKYYLFPENLNIDELLREVSPPEIPGFRFNKEHLAFILNLIFKVPNDNPRVKVINGYTPIKGKYLKNQIRGYQHYFRYLLEAGVLESDGQYIPGKKCKGYRYASKYVTKPTLIPIREKKPEAKPVDRINQKLYSHLIRSLKGPLNILYGEALKFIDSELWALQGAAAGIISAKREGQLRYARALSAIRKIRDGNLTWKADETIRRFYTPITSMPKEVRKFLHYDGEQLISIDLKNSQPFILLALLRNEFWVCKEEYRGININDIINYNQSNYLHATYHKHHNLSNLIISYSKIIMVDSFSDPEFKEEVKEYGILTSTGSLYQTLEEDQLEIEEIKLLEGKHFKQDVLRGFFSDNRCIDYYRVPGKFLFRRRFPKIYGFISALKRKEKKWFAHLLQTTESYLFLIRIAKRIYSEGIPVYTIHDNVVTTAHHKKRVIEIMESEIYKAIGHKPSFDCKLWLNPVDFQC
jgi:hypothetical protein